ncbi:hypothetical protein GLOIN_2v1772147 [Rhizophagus irregularis DAOM 181602=DAOM 197198]|uniref:Uncharacterized protein n=1 Tax=Rhizophagus irregularis (strain DAOM 181602 / DAOM 197198 / MUCL 43194) TaxID=747089 RepID=A0A2P4Q829_RHIID|nr:hypothetical protein GLOIN_2v1772147 [Rhizophagus irregularis DAOM 181602=DAOM 197198]POG73784.1 hypothetical protein GLOIN_2v1772147 [Rhizophagus irregularis DAOM 181602=DAOM 197198]GET62229.1 hypothetical protein GLOIN_2v1772147 [Rhizophagus irregularis DAOM 181602=DAOM 197198]|eukprot:XP_025180650.1 hypothetical protein GLOIN_2v1772147 [Rhizophagus irregularis DAOM 181602=DAOM 197198]
MSNNSNNKKNNKKNNKQKQQSDKTNKSTNKSSPTKSNKQKQQRFQEEIPSERSNRQQERMEKEIKQTKQQRFQEDTPSEGSKHQWERTEEESDPNKMSNKTNKSTSKSAPIKTEEESNLNKTSDKTNKSTNKLSPIKSNKQKQQRFQEETPSKGSKRQRGRTEEKSDLNETKKTPSEESNRQRERTEEESDLNETSDKTNKSTSKLAPIKLILKSVKSIKLTQEEFDNEVIEIELPNIPKDQQEMLSEMKKQYGNIRISQKFVLVVKDDQGNEKIIDDDDTNLEAKNLKLKKQIDEVQADGSRTAGKMSKRIKTKKFEWYEEELEEEGSGSNNNDKYDEKEARAEMKSILKTIDETRGLDYNEMFNNAKNLKIRRNLVPELRSALTLLMDMGKADENKHWVHSNNQVHDVSNDL